jgi:sodium-dependent phosphate cotransporter
LFAKAEFDDVWIGVCLLIIALVMLVGCLGLLVKILNALMKAKLVDFIKNTLNKDLPHVPWLTGYVALIIGAVVTFVIQSSSVFTSTLTPLVGAGIFTIERAYVLTLGSNIGKLLYYFIYFFISRSF